MVDQAQRTAVLVDPTSGTVVQRTALDLRSDDKIQVSGAPHAARIYVVAARGVLEVCDLAASGCSSAVALGTGGAELGTAVESGGRVFVPDYTGGRVWIVDLRDLHVIARPQVLPVQTRFQLLARDGVIFFNDPQSEHAGVLQLDGGVRLVAKYDPRHPGAGLTSTRLALFGLTSKGNRLHVLPLALVYTLFFVPFTYWIDRFAYRRHQARMAGGGAAATPRPAKKR